MRPFAFVVGAGLAMLPLSAWAQVSDEEAAEIQGRIKQWVSENLGRLSPNVQVVFDRGIEVTPSGDRYLAVIPPATVFIDPDAQVTVEQVTVDLFPRDDGWFEVAWEIPDTYEIVTTGPGGGEETSTITIGEQFGRGVWAPDLATFTDSEILLRQVTFTPPHDVGSATVASIEASGQGNEVEPGVFDFVGRLSLSDLRFTNTHSGDSGSIDEFGAALSYDRMRIAAFNELSQQLNELGRRYPPNARGEMGQEYVTQLGELFRNTPTLLDGAEAEYYLTGLQFDSDDTVVNLGDARLGLSIAGLEGERGDLGLRLGFDAVTVEPAPPFVELMPNLGRLDIAISEIPNDAVVEAFIGAMQGAATMGPETALMMAGGALQQAAMQAGTSVTFNDVRLIADTYKSVLTGEARTDPSAALGGVADLLLVISNLDALIRSLDGIPDAADAQAGLTMLQAMGAQDIDDEGNPARSYRFEVTSDGMVMLNGADFGPLMDNLAR